MKICCSMLTADRRELAARAIMCWVENLIDGGCRSHLAILDSGSSPIDSNRKKRRGSRVHYRRTQAAPLSSLMNEGCAFAVESNPRYIAKWDDDDWFGPRRLKEQLAFAEQTGAWVIGYNDLPIIDTRTGEVSIYRHPGKYAVGTSLFFRTEAWKQFPFPAGVDGKGSDGGFVSHWITQGKFACTSCFVDGVPRVIARLHGGNTSMTRMFTPAPQEAADLVRKLIGWEQK